MSVNVLRFVRESARDQECISLKSLQFISAEFLTFVMYYIYGSVWAIPTYRVYRLYDTSMQTKKKIELWTERILIHALELKLESMLQSLECSHIMFLLRAWTHAHINVTLFTRIARNCNRGCLLGLQGPTAHVASLQPYPQASFPNLQCCSLKGLLFSEQHC